MKSIKFLCLLVISVIMLTACNIGVPEDKIIVYTNSGSEGRAEWLTDKAEDAGFDIQVVQMGGNTLANRLIAEKNNPVADVTYGMSQMDWQKVKSQDVLVPYTPKWIKETDDDTPFVDEDHYYNPLVEQRIVQIYNQDVFDEQSAPHTFSDYGRNPNTKVNTQYLHHSVA